MVNVVSGVVLKKSTWKDAGASALAGGIQSVVALITKSPVLAGLVTTIAIGAMPNKFVFDEMNKTAIVCNTVQDATVQLLLG